MSVTYRIWVRNRRHKPVKKENDSVIVFVFNRNSTKKLSTDQCQLVEKVVGEKGSLVITLTLNTAVWEGITVLVFFFFFACL